MAASARRFAHPDAAAQISVMAARLAGVPPSNDVA
jgi:hypothetical protein